MGAGSSGNFTRLVEKRISSDSVVGSFEFELNGLAPRNNLLDYFYFVDGNGDAVDATAGTVLVELSPELPIYQKVSQGTFDAVNALNASWCKPNGFGKAISIKITLTDIAGPPTGFQALLTQSVD